MGDKAAETFTQTGTVGGQCFEAESVACSGSLIIKRRSYTGDKSRNVPFDITNLSGKMADSHDL